MILGGAGGGGECREDHLWITQTYVDFQKTHILLEEWQAASTRKETPLKVGERISLALALWLVFVRTLFSIPWNHERTFCLTLLFLLSGGMVHLPHSVTPRGPHRTVKLWFLFSVVVVIGLDGQTDIFRVWSPEEWITKRCGKEGSCVGSIRLLGNDTEWMAFVTWLFRSLFLYW